MFQVIYENTHKIHVTRIIYITHITYITHTIYILKVDNIFFTTYFIDK